MKEIIQNRAKEFLNSNTLNDIITFKEILKEFIEHPTKPGYKRNDIIYFIKIIDKFIKE